MRSRYELVQGVGLVADDDLVSSIYDERRESVVRVVLLDSFQRELRFSSRELINVYISVFNIVVVEVFLCLIAVRAIGQSVERDISYMTSWMFGISKFHDVNTPFKVIYTRLFPPIPNV